MQPIYPIIPSLSYNVDPRCDMRCEYCPVFYENYQESGQLLSPELVKATFVAAVEAGIITFRLSGGEPLLRPDHVIELSQTLNKTEKAKDLNIRLNTNGSRLETNAEKLKAAGLSVLKISVDTLDAEKSAKISGANKLHVVLRGIIKALELGMSVELNMVYTKQNSEDIWELIEYCKENRIFALKVLDLVEYDDPAYWRANYLSPQELMNKLTALYGPPSICTLSSGRGVRMQRFRINEVTSVLLKDCRQGTTYSKTFCKGCLYFPCQEGFYNLSLNSDGKLKPCRLITEKYVDLAESLNLKSPSDATQIAYKVIKGLFADYYSDVFFYDGWANRKSS